MGLDPGEATLLNEPTRFLTSFSAKCSLVFNFEWQDTEDEPTCLNAEDPKTDSEESCFDVFAAPNVTKDPIKSTGK